MIFECAPYKGFPTSPAHVHEACGLPEVGTICIMMQQPHTEIPVLIRLPVYGSRTVESRLKAFLCIDIFRTFYYFMVMIIIR
jgi:hypothetical protein